MTNEKNISQDTININEGLFTNNDGAKINTGTAINIDEDAGLTANASDINANSTTAQINNKGVITFTGGENNNNLSGRGNLTIDGEVTNLEGKTINQSSITVSADKKFIVKDATDISTTGDGIVNAGTVTFNAGKNTNIISGDTGRLEIAGTVENDANVTQKEVEVISGKLTNDANRTITVTTVTNKADIANDGEISATTVTNDTNARIINTGTITATDLTNNATATITNNGKITGTDNTITNSGEMTNNGEISAKEITNNANATITNNAEKTITATTVTNSGTITSSGTIDVTTFTNSGTVENAGEVTVTDLTNSGTITNEGTIESTNAIANSGTITSNADNMIAEIVNTGTYNVKGGTVSYQVTGENGKININDSEVTISTSIAGNNVNLGTTLKLKEESYLVNTSTLTINNGATLDLQNNKTSDVVAAVKITAASWNLKLDIDLAEQKTDTLNVVSVANNSQAIVNGINLLSDRGQAKVKVSELSINATANPDEYDSVYTTNLKYKVTTENGEDGTYLILTAEGYGGLPIAVYDGATSYSVTENIDKVQGWIDDHNYLIGDLVINGNDKTIKAEPETGTLDGMIVSDDTKLTMNNLKSFEGFENALKVNESGELIVSSVTFTNNTGAAVITNAGTVTLSSVTFNGNGADIDIANSGTLNIEGEGVTLQTGINGTGTTIIATGTEVVNANGSTISQKDITINGALTNNNATDGAIATTNQIIINENAVVTSSANAISAANGIINKGTMTFTGGKNTNAIDSEFDGYGRIEIVGDVENAAEIYQKDIIVTSGKLTNDAGTTIYAEYLTNNTEIVNNGIINPSNVTNEANASIENTGEINATNITNKTNAIINNKENGKIYATNLDNDGTINNASDINISALFESSGTVTNTGTITAGDLTNYANGIINNEENGKINATSKLDNKGIINNKSGAELKASELTNSGTITSSGTIDSLTIINDTNGTINNEEGGEIVADSALINNGTITNKSSITARNNITNNENGTINNKENAEINATRLTNS